MKHSNLSGKVAVVTGGTGGLGSVIVERLVQEGARVATFDRTADRKENSNEEIIRIQTDVTDESSVSEGFDEVGTRLGIPSVLVNTVGGFLPSKPLSEVTIDDWNRMMTLNLRSAFLCCREAVRRMPTSSYGRIISISAMVGVYPSRGRIPYAISKAGVNLLTELLAQELAQTAITVNAVAPSIIDTPANREAMPGDDHSRWVKPSEIADLIVWLCSEAGRSFSGTTVRAFAGIRHY